MLLVIPMSQFQMFCFTSSQTHRALVSGAHKFLPVARKNR
jgi:hypothetical protein